MATIVKRSGKFSIRFADAGGKYRTLATGVETEEEAAKFKDKIERLLLIADDKACAVGKRV